jgi:hypothetical protein
LEGSGEASLEVLAPSLEVAHERVDPAGHLGRRASRRLPRRTWHVNLAVNVDPVLQAPRSEIVETSTLHFRPDLLDEPLVRPAIG